MSGEKGEGQKRYWTPTAFASFGATRIKPMDRFARKTWREPLRKKCDEALVQGKAGDR